MKFVDSEGRLFGRFSVIDLACLLLVLALAVGVVLRLGTAKEKAIVPTAQRETVTVEYTVKILGVREMTVEAIQVGDELHDTDGPNLLGTVVEKTVEPHVSEIAKTDGTYALAEVPERYAVTLTIRQEGYVNDRGRLFVDQSYALRTNMGVRFYSKYYATSGTVTEMHLVNG